METRELRYPELTRRYFSSVIDGILVFTTAMALAFALQAQSLVGVRVVAVLLVFLTYEPILTSRRCTVGQFAMGIRVRRYHAVAERISLPAAYLRYVLKLLLGFFSFFAMSFNRERRALHDLAAGSIVVDSRTSQ
jgi:uncharacterized RDD family membrane protein YckC